MTFYDDFYDKFCHMNRCHLFLQLVTIISHKIVANCRDMLQIVVTFSVASPSRHPLVDFAN